MINSKLTLFFITVVLTTCFDSSTANAVQVGTNYYVDAMAGDDSNPGTAEQPFKTYLPFVWTYSEPNPDIGKIQLQPGDEVVFRKGTYSANYQTPDDIPQNQYRGFYIRDINGSPTEPVLIRGEPGAVIDALPPVGQTGSASEFTSMEIGKCSNLAISGLEFTGLGRAMRVYESSSVSIHNNWVHDIDGTDNDNMEPLQFVGNTGVIEVFNNLLHDNFDRTNADTNGQKTENSRHMGFYSNQGNIRVHHNYVFNSAPITSQFSGSGIVNKHAGNAVFEVDRNVIRRVWASSVGTNNPNSHIHRNLILESDEIVVKDFGGPSYFNDILVSNNTCANCDGGLVYRPNDTWYPSDDYNDIGPVSFLNNLVTDVSNHDNENGTITILGDDTELAVAEKLMMPGMLNFGNNRYSHPTNFRAIWFVGLPIYEMLDFQQWQAFGFDFQGAESLELDNCFFPTNGSELGWYQEDGIRLSLFTVENNSAVMAPTIPRGQEINFKLIRSGDGVDLNSGFSVSFEPSIANQILLPQQTFLPGQRSVEFTATILNDIDLDSEIALLVSPIANGTENNVGAWVRVVPTIILGDVNQDGNVNFLDISSFIGVLSTGSFQTEADIDQNEVVNFLDIAPFIGLLTGE